MDGERPVSGWGEAGRWVDVETGRQVGGEAGWSTGSGRSAGGGGGWLVDGERMVGEWGARPVSAGACRPVGARAGTLVGG